MTCATAALCTHSTRMTQSRTGLNRRMHGARHPQPVLLESSLPDPVPTLSVHAGLANWIFSPCRALVATMHRSLATRAPALLARACNRACNAMSSKSRQPRLSAHQGCSETLHTAQAEEPFQCHVYAAGEGAPVLILFSDIFGSCTRDHQALCERLRDEEDFTVLAPDAFVRDAWPEEKSPNGKTSSGHGCPVHISLSYVSRMSSACSCIAPCLAGMLRNLTPSSGARAVCDLHLACRRLYQPCGCRHSAIRSQHTWSVGGHRGYGCGWWASHQRCYCQPRRGGPPVRSCCCFLWHAHRSEPPIRSRDSGGAVLRTK